MERGRREAAGGRAGPSRAKNNALGGSARGGEAVIRAGGEPGEGSELRGARGGPALRRRGAGEGR